MKLYYQGKGKNFGDAVNHDLFEGLFNQQVQRSRHYTADCYAIGSILGKALYNTKKSPVARENVKRHLYAITLKRHPIHILGSGFIEDVRETMGKLQPFRPLNVVALQGHKRNNGTDPSSKAG